MSNEKKENTYLVGIKEVHVNYVEVVATSEEEAKDKAAEAAWGDEIFQEFSHTLSSETWTIEEKEQ